MASYFSYECRCDRCGTIGQVFWSEGGYRDQDEWIKEIWGEFKELPPIDDYTGRRQRGAIVCRRCGASASEAASRQNTPAEERRRRCRS